MYSLSKLPESKAHCKTWKNLTQTIILVFLGKIIQIWFRRRLFGSISNKLRQNLRIRNNLVGLVNRIPENGENISSHLFPPFKIFFLRNFNRTTQIF